jgi:MoxR-like ATPase
MLIKSLAASVGCDFKRIQFTPDLLPSDITGVNFFNMKKSEFEFIPGPIFANIVLADEINRATPKTQSALLEAMQEHTVTVMGVSRKLEEPFFVLATQNPVEQDGTYPLPEAQMDRFMFKIIVKNPSLDELMDIVNMTQKTMAEVADAACNGEDLLTMRAVANAIPVAEDVMRYAMMLCSATHPDSECASEAAKKYVRLGASPRAGQALISAAKVKALMNGRYNVSYNDVNELAYPVLRHRMKLTFEAVAERVSPDEIVKMIIDELSGKPATKTEATAEVATEEKKKKFGRK